MVGRQFLFSFLLLFYVTPVRSIKLSFFFLVWFVFVLHTLLSICTNTYERMKWKNSALDLWGTRTSSVIAFKTLIWHQIWRKTLLPFLLCIKTIIIIVIVCSSLFLNVFASFNHHTQLGHSYKPSKLPSPNSTSYSLPSWDLCLVLGCIWDCQVWDSSIKEDHGGSMWLNWPMVTGLTIYQQGAVITEIKVDSVYGGNRGHIVAFPVSAIFQVE